jgi:hypothetical protein
MIRKLSKIPKRIPTPRTFKFISYQAKDTKCSAWPLGTRVVMQTDKDKDEDEDKDSGPSGVHNLEEL